MYHSSIIDYINKLLQAVFSDTSYGGSRYMGLVDSVPILKQGQVQYYVPLERNSNTYAASFEDGVLNQQLPLQVYHKIKNTQQEMMQGFGDEAQVKQTSYMSLIATMRADLSHTNSDALGVAIMMNIDQPISNLQAKAWNMQKAKVWATMCNYNQTEILKKEYGLKRLAYVPELLIVEVSYIIEVVAKASCFNTCSPCLQLPV